MDFLKKIFSSKNKRTSDVFPQGVNFIKKKFLKTKGHQTWNYSKKRFFCQEPHVDYFFKDQKTLELDFLKENIFFQKTNGPQMCIC